MTQPEGFVYKQRPDCVYILLKAIYGLKQASRAWHRVIDAILTALVFRRLESDPSLYILQHPHSTVHILVYVNDMLLTGRSRQQLAHTAYQVGEKVEIRIEPDVTKFLGKVITRIHELPILRIHSTYMIEERLEKYGMAHARGNNVSIRPRMLLDSPCALRDRDEGVA